MPEGNNADQEQKLKELEEKIRELEQKEAKHNRSGVAGGVLRGLGDVIPGLGNMLQGLEDSEAFQERLDAINKQVDKRFRETPLKTAETGIGKGIPKVRRGYSVETLKSEGRKQVKNPLPREEKEIIVDIFKEDEQIRIIVELPGVEEKDIKLELKGNSLIIYADTLYHKYYKKIHLDYPVKGPPEASYKNGILEIELEKDG
jgi:HSP20 family protein